MTETTTYVIQYRPLRDACAAWRDQSTWDSPDAARAEIAAMHERSGEALVEFFEYRVLRRVESVIA